MSLGYREPLKDITNIMNDEESFDHARRVWRISRILQIGFAVDLRTGISRAIYSTNYKDFIDSCEFEVHVWDTEQILMLL